MQVEFMADGLLKVERNDSIYLGINTHIPGRSFAVQRLSSQSQTPGWIVDHDEVTEWAPSGFTEHDNEVVMYGPYLEGVTLQEVLGFEAREVFSYLQRFVDAVRLLMDRHIPVGRYHTRGVIFLKDGGTLLLPLHIMQTIREHEPIEQQILCYENTSHPDLDPVDNLSYFLAAISYRALTGDFPYRSETLEDLHIRIRAGYSLDPIYQEPRIREEVSAFIIAILRDPQHHTHSLEEWQSVLATWNRSGPYREVTEQGRDALKLQADATWKRMTRTFNRKEYIRKHGKATVLIVAMVLIVGTIPGTIISRALAPRSTHGFSAEKVVSTYYLSMNTLDQTTMQDCVIDGAGKNTISEVMNLYVTSRMRMSVEMRSGILGAEQWVKEGKPALKRSSFVFGVSDLAVTVQSHTAASVVARATYLQWQPQFPAEPNGKATAQPAVIKSEAYSRIDTLYLKKDRGDWVIYRIVQDKDTLVPADTVTSTIQ